MPVCKVCWILIVSQPKAKVESITIAAPQPPLASINITLKGVSEIAFNVKIVLSLRIVKSYQSVSLILFSAQKLPCIVELFVKGVYMVVGATAV